jgi:heme A synthase
MPVHLWPSGQVCKRVSQTGGQRSGSSQGAAVVSVVSVVVGAAAVVGVASVVVLVPAVLVPAVLVPAVLVLVLVASASGWLQARVSRSRSGARGHGAVAQ